MVDEAPADIGLGSPVAASNVPRQSPANAAPLTVEQLSEPKAERPALTRDSFAKKYPPPANARNAFLPKQLQTQAERRALSQAEDPPLGKLA